MMRSPINDVDLTEYRRAHSYAVAMLNNWYECDANNPEIADVLWNEFREHRLDPDGRAIRMLNKIRCSADALISVFRACKMEKHPKDIISTFQYYTHTPIFYFPMEMGGINQTRASVYGDRIDFTLYDLKTAIENDIKECRLLSAYEKTYTSEWLNNFPDFDSLLDWYGIKGIFTDDNGNVINIETDLPINTMPPSVPFSLGWSHIFYDNLKKRIDQWYAVNDVNGH